MIKHPKAKRAARKSMRSHFEVSKKIAELHSLRQEYLAQDIADLIAESDPTVKQKKL